MKVKLIQATQNPIDVMWTAARTCYSEKSPIEIWEEENRYPKLKGNDAITDEYYNEMQNKMWNLVKKVLSSGHQSIAEHVSFTFAIEGVSRTLTHQLVRHRHCTFSQQSQRYVEIKEDMNELYKLLHSLSPANSVGNLMVICNKYFVGVTKDNVFSYAEALWEYLKRVHNGEKPEDARMILPNATKTNIVMTINLRELIHVSNLRLCSRAQAEIQRLFREIKKTVLEYNPEIAKMLVPTCEINGFCKEHKCCGRKPRLSDLIKN